MNGALFFGVSQIKHWMLPCIFCQKNYDFYVEVTSFMTKNDINGNSNAAEVDVFATFYVLMHVEIDMFKNILFPYSVSHLRKLYTMCAGLVGPKTMEIAEAIIDLMEQRYVNFILLHHKEKR